MAESCTGRTDLTIKSVISECESRLGCAMLKTEQQAITLFIDSKYTFVAISQLCTVKMGSSITPHKGS